MAGLQNEMESRVLAFTPHFVIDQNDGFHYIGISDEQADGSALQEEARRLSFGAGAEQAPQKPLEFAPRCHPECKIPYGVAILEQGDAE